MKMIDYVVRDSAGALERGLVPEAVPVTTITVGAGEEISLNLRQIDLRSFQRNGDVLVVELADGRLVVVENYFNSDGAPNRLFISADGYLNEVAFVDGAEGALHAQYGPTAQWGKWSPSDDLIFLGRTDVAALPGDSGEVSMLGAGLLGATGLWGAGAAAAAVGAGTLLGGDGTDGAAGGAGTDTGGGAVQPVPPADPYVNNAQSASTVGGDGADLTLAVSGGGEPGDTVSVTVGDQTQTTVIGADGTFEAVFSGSNFPADGAHDAVVSFAGAGGSATLDGPSFVIDTVAPDVTITSGAVSTGDSFNADGYAGGIKVAGIGEPEASVAITIAGVTRQAVVAADGSWSLTWQAGSLPEGEYTQDMTVVTTDAVGNSRTSTDQILVDTVSTVSVETAAVETDGVVNAVEHADGVTLTGSAQAGSSVVVSLGAATRTVTADTTGAWSADFAASDVPTGEYDAAITAVATDTLGNVAQTSGTITIDTGVNPFALTSTTGGSDGVVNAAETAGGLVLTGIAEAGSQVSVSFSGVTRQATVAADGTWSAAFTAAEIPAGEYTAPMIAIATDAAGNTATLSQDVVVDTVANTLSINHPIEGDDVINQIEASDGVVLSGSSVPGAVVQVAMGGITQTSFTDGSGAWQTVFSSAQIAPGTYDATITATSTDAAGNVNHITDTVRVDTSVDNLSVAADVMETDGVISNAERADGMTVTGTVEAGSRVEVTLGGATVLANVDSAGNWSAAFPASALADGEYGTDVIVKATDPAGNMALISDGVQVDTYVNTLNFNAASTGSAIEGDGTVNAVEAMDGINLGGQVEAGSSVMVTFNGVDVPANVAADGTWAVLIPASAIAPGSYDASITVTATDPVGNTDSLSQIVKVDTDAPDGPVVAAFTRDGAGLRSISTEGDHDSMEVSAVDDAGAVSDVATTDTYIGAFDETLHAFGSTVPDGSDLIVTDTDTAGNSTSTYLALDDETTSSTVDLSSPALGNYQIDAVDLQFAEEATLMLTDAQVIGLSETTDTLIVHGGADDTVQISGAARTGSTQVGGQSYDTYTSGEATLIIDSDIKVEDPPVI